MCEIIKRYGKGGPAGSSGKTSCPDILELDDGNIAVIGTDITEKIACKLSLEASCADYEKIVKIPRELFLSLRGEIPKC